MLAQITLYIYLYFHCVSMSMYTCAIHMYEVRGEVAGALILSFHYLHLSNQTQIIGVVSLAPLLAKSYLTHLYPSLT